MHNASTTRFGRTRSGRSPWPGAVLIGLLVTAALGSAAALLNDGPRAWLLVALLVALNLPVLVFGGWAVLVDRSTIRGATQRPEESVENSWLDRAANGAFYDLLTVLGLGLAAFNLVPAARDLPARHALTAYVLFAMLDVAARYLVISRGEA
ncbi:hypothetical protein [Luteococcus peritonei]|uniref:Uncharacterized protein n=1 Tax=Luteococcus peritonei TaxID=88874 RepID=A0ABW4RSU9_9ACTN